jgi:hypothetical protein
MSQHNQGMLWVLEALGPILYMGSLGTQVVCALLFSRSSLPLLYPQTQYGITVFHCERYMQLHSSSGCSKYVSDGSAILEHVHISFCQG